MKLVFHCICPMCDARCAVTSSDGPKCIAYCRHCKVGFLPRCVYATEQLNIFERFLKRLFGR
jgi:hypothetical protein